MRRLRARRVQRQPPRRAVRHLPDAAARCGAHTAGKAKGRYTCPVSGSLVTLGLTGVQLDQPMRVALIAAGGQYHGRELGPRERSWLAAETARRQAGARGEFVRPSDPVAAAVHVID